MSGIKSITKYVCPECGFIHQNFTPSICKACGNPMEAAEFMRVKVGLEKAEGFFDPDAPIKIHPAISTPS